MAEAGRILNSSACRARSTQTQLLNLWQASPHGAGGQTVTAVMRIAPLWLTRNLFWQPPGLRNELTLERLASIHPVKPRFDALKKEAADLDIQIKQLTDALDNLLRMQQRSVTIIFWFIEYKRPEIKCNFILCWKCWVQMQYCKKQYKVNKLLLLLNSVFVTKGHTF
jgi:hypothetical protein